MVQLFRTSFVNGVVNGRAASGPRARNLVAQRSRIARERLNDLRLVIEGHHERFVFIAAQHAKKKTDRSILFELDAVANAVGSVEQHPDAQGQIRLLAEITNVLRLAFVENFEVSLLQVGYQFVATV